MRCTKDFFISYTACDREWAEWIAWVLEDAGHPCVLQAWDFRPGEDFVQLMNDALAGSERTLAVISPAYFESRFAAGELTASFVGRNARSDRLVPARIADFEVPAVLAAINYIDLVDVTDETVARRILLDGVRRDRVKPDEKPPFPRSAAGPIGASTDLRPVFPRAGSTSPFPAAGAASRVTIASESEEMMQGLTRGLEQIKKLDDQNLLDPEVSRSAQRDLLAKLLALAASPEAT